MGFIIHYQKSLVWKFSLEFMLLNINFGWQYLILILLIAKPCICS